MTKTFIFQSNIVQRLSVLMLAVVLVFSFASSPVKATTGALQISTTLGDVASAHPYLALIVTVLIALDYSFRNADELVAEAQRIYNNCSTAVQNWCRNIGDRIVQGETLVVKVIDDYCAQIASLLGITASALATYIVIPATFEAVDTLTATDVVADTYIGALTKTNTLVGRIANSVSTLVSRVTDIPSQINAKVITLTESLKEWQSRININLGNWFDSIGTVVHAINGNMLGWFERIGASAHGINDKFAHFRNDFSSFVSSLGDKITSLPTTIVEAISSIPNKVASAFDDFKTSIEAKIQSAAEAIASAIAGSAVVQGAENIINSINLGIAEVAGVIAGAVSSIMLFIGALEGFTGTFGRLFEIPLISALLYVSLAVGVISLVLNLAKNGSRDSRGGCNCKCARW